MKAPPQANASGAKIVDSAEARPASAEKRRSPSRPADGGGAIQWLHDSLSGIPADRGRVQREGIATGYEDLVEAARRSDPVLSPPSSQIHAAAKHGTSGPSRPLPFRELIQSSFGQHDVASIAAHTDEAAAAGARAMSAAAFATGDHVAFAGTPSLHTAAHEAAHVIQQRSGVQLAGGVGQVGDAYERHADAVADRVVRGLSSEALLDEMGDANADPAGAVQRKIGFEFQTVGAGAFHQLSETQQPKPTKFKQLEKTKFYNGPGYNLESDEGDFEFVTGPFDETNDGFQALQLTLRHMAALAAGMRNKNIIVDTDTFTGDGLSLNGEANQHIRNVSMVGKSMQADPQTTVGIKLDQLFNLASLLSRAPARQNVSDPSTVAPAGPSVRTAGQVASEIGWKQGGQLDPGAQYQELIQAAVALVSRFDDISPKMKGFMLLVAQYIAAGKKMANPDKPAWMAKFWLPMLSRTDIADVFATLSREDRQTFTGWLEQPGFYQALGVQPGDDLFPATTKNAGMQWEKITEGFKLGVQEWLVGLTEGADLTALFGSLGDISNEPFAGPGHEYWLGEGGLREKQDARARYMGSGYNPRMNSSTDIGGQAQDPSRTGVVMELRKLGAKLHPEEWEKFAIDVFSLIFLLNRGDQGATHVVLSEQG